MKTDIKTNWKQFGTYSQRLYAIALIVMMGIGMSASLCLTGCGDGGTDPAPQTTATPTADPSAGTYAATQSVTLSTATAGARIYYTLNGDTPAAGGTLFSGAISISTTTTLKAIAVKEGMNDSGILTAVYTISGSTAGTAPTITTTSLLGGTVEEPYRQTLTATGDTPIIWSVEGALPNGLSLSDAGVISGTPTTAGTFNFTVKATNATGDDPKAFSIVIAPIPTLGVIWTAIPAGAGAEGGSAFGTTTQIYGIAYGNNKFVAVGYGGIMAYSSDGVNWTAIRYGYGPGNSGPGFSTFDYSLRINGIAYGNNKFVATGDGGRMAYSSDGIEWTAIQAGTGTANSQFTSSQIIYAITYGNNKFVATGQSGTMAYSSDGVTWTAVANSTFGTSEIRVVAWGNNKFVAGGQSGTMAYSSDGVTWTAVANSTFGTSTITGIAWGNNKFVAGGAARKMAYSSDGITWTTVADSTFSSGQIVGIAYGNNKFVAVGGGTTSQMAYSSDGVTWTAVTDSTFGSSIIYGIAWGNNKFIAVGFDGKMAWSE